jgi:hypothetical protein
VCGVCPDAFQTTEFLGCQKSSALKYGVIFFEHIKKIKLTNESERKAQKFECSENL